jgi:poly [ADP-ribose] polymerase
MSTLTKKITLVFADAGSADGVQHNKVWSGELYDDDVVKTLWGRIGYSLQSKEFPGVGEGFLLKKQAEKIKGGYTEARVINTENTGSMVRPVAVSDLHEVAKSQLLKTSKHPVLDKLIERLVKSNVHKITSSTNIVLDDTTGLFQTPLGIITPDAISDAREVLVDILNNVKNQKYDSKLNDFVSKYLRLIPQNIGMKFDVKRIFPDVSSVQKQEDILQSLEASHKAITTIKPSADGKKSVQEQVFQVDLDVLSDNSEIERLSKWFYGSNHSTHGYRNVKIQNFLKVKIHDNWNSFDECLGNVKEVWHGTGEGNLLNILKSGLRVSPPSTTYLTGKMFGNGHYGALDSSKSMQYTFGRFGGNSGTSGWLYVMDFCLGNTYFIKSYGGNILSGYDSIWAKKENTGLRFDELIVPRDNQVRIKYLLEVK